VKSIAELLVETTARFACMTPRGDSTPAERAYEIVASIYGPPCKEMVNLETEYRGGVGRIPPIPVSSFVPAPDGNPGRACGRCGWPRSLHA
jgi:hypothetical protein